MFWYEEESKSRRVQGLKSLRVKESKSQRVKSLTVMPEKRGSLEFDKIYYS